ncbi:hypothetical protein FOS14_12035 [Skermania sp. ID1734]|nr:hypothetical protein FOS14_12035 [Skermania sp. ID1734]
MAVAAIAAGPFLSACDQVKEATNKGGDTPCNEYIGQDSDTQRTTVTKYLKSRNDGNDPSGTEVNSAMTAIDLLCRVQANAKTPIKNADLTGILAPK